MSSSNLANDILLNFGGVIRNNLNHLLQNVDDLENAISIVSDSPYIETNNLSEYLKPCAHAFSILGLNILNAKFDKLKMLIDDLADDKFEFSAICLQETWVEGTDPDVSVYSLDNYICIPLGATCSSHGGLLIYLHKNFQFAIRDFYSPNNLWEGQFVDIFGNGLNQKVTLCNIYRRPQDRNIDIDMFMNDLVPIIENLSREQSDKFLLEILI